MSGKIVLPPTMRVTIFAYNRDYERIYSCEAQTNDWPAIKQLADQTRALPEVTRVRIVIDGGS